MNAQIKELAQRSQQWWSTEGDAANDIVLRPHDLTMDLIVFDDLKHIDDVWRTYRNVQRKLGWGAAYAFFELVRTIPLRAYDEAYGRDGTEFVLVFDDEEESSDDYSAYFQLVDAES